VKLRRVSAARFPLWRERPPLRTVILAASFCGYFALLVYCDIARRLHRGYKAVTRDGAVVLTEIAPDSPAARAGMAVGDRLIAVNDLVIIDHDSWGAVAYVYEINDPMPVVIERNGRPQELTLLLPPQSPDFCSRSQAARCSSCGWRSF